MQCDDLNRIGLSQDYVPFGDDLYGCAGPDFLQNPDEGDKTLLYWQGTLAASGRDPEDWTQTGGAGGWYMSAVELAQFLAYLRYDDDFLTKENRALMFESYLGFNDPAPPERARRRKENAMSTVLMLLPACDYDPTESAVPWEAILAAGHDVVFATPAGEAAPADTRLTDRGFGVLSPVLMTRRDDLSRYRAMADASAHRRPLRYADVRAGDFDALLVPGGHAAGMKTLLESEAARAVVAEMFALDRVIGALCHGVLLLARTLDPGTGRSVLHGRRTTALPRTLELSAWMLTAAWLGSYYRTYPTTVQSEVTAALADPAHFAAGPLLPVRDSAAAPQRGFVVRDGRYLSGRWPGDCHRFAREYVDLLA